MLRACRWRGAAAVAAARVVAPPQPPRRPRVSARLTTWLLHTRVAARTRTLLQRGCAYTARYGVTLQPTTLLVIVLTVVPVVLYVVTLRRFELTTRTRHLHMTRLMHACDILVVTHRLTGTTRVYDVSKEKEEQMSTAAEANTCDTRKSNDKDGNSDSDDGHGTTLLPLREPIVTRVVYVSRLLYATRLYAHKTHCRIAVDVSNELSPYHFVDYTYSKMTTRATRATTATAAAAAQRPPQEQQQQQQPQQQQSSPPLLLCVDAVVRPSVPSMHAGVTHMMRYKMTVERVLRDMLEQRYRDYLLQHRLDVRTPRSYADELLRNGQLNGVGVTLRDVVPDLHAWQREVAARVRAATDKYVLMYDFSLRLASPT